VGCTDRIYLVANQRHRDKVKVQTYLHKTDALLLRETVKTLGFANLADFLRAVARGAVKVAKNIPVVTGMTLNLLNTYS